MKLIAPKEVRYIKLGAGGCWAQTSFEKGEVHFGYSTVPHDLCVAGDWGQVARFLMETEDKSLGKARDAVREIRDFYTLGTDCLWITFADGHLWWTFAQPEVTWLGNRGPSHSARVRQTVEQWCKTDLNGEPLRIDELSSRLTQVGAYRQTICKVKAAEYLLRHINGIEEPIFTMAREAKTAMIAASKEMITGLHWADFETMVDLIFFRTGWQRLSRVGGNLKDVDMVLQHPTTGETAFVQVKSRAGQPVLEDYIARFQASSVYDRLFFICHTPKGSLSFQDHQNIHVWTGNDLADAAVKAGLYDWLMEKSA